VPFFDRGEGPRGSPLEGVGAPCSRAAVEDHHILNREAEQSSYSAAPALDTIVPPYPSSLEIMQRHGLAPGESLVNEDPPLHQRRRKRLARAFSPHRMRELEPWVRDLTGSFLDRFVKRGRADLVAEMFTELPARVVFKFFGIPDEDVEEVKAHAGPFAIFNWGYPSEAEQNAIVENLGAYTAYCRRHVARLKASSASGEDAACEYIQAHLEDPELFPEEYVARLLPNFLYAGHETTTSQSGNALRILLEHPEQWRRICADSTLVPNAVEECIRAVSSVVAWRRRTHRPVTVRGVEIPAGAKLLLYLGAANRDPTVFPDADVFDVERENAKRHLSFGYGAHLCIGAPLERLELTVVLEELSRRLPHLRLVEGQSWSYSPNTSFRGPKSLLVEWDPARNPVAADRP
jgi:cytochrome P450